MAARDPSVKVVADVLAGKHDGHLEDILLAINKRATDGRVTFVWRITLDGESWDALTVTAGELRQAERITGRPWHRIDPRERIDDFVALVVAHYRAKGNSIELAVALAEQLTPVEIGKALDEYEIVNGT